MTGTARGDRRQNTTSYSHPQETHLIDLHYAMEYNALGQPIIRTVQSSSGYEPSGTDAFGRLQVAAPQTLLDSQNVYKENTKFYTATSGTASTSFDANASLVNMNVNSASGDQVIKETKRVFPYQPGKALEILATFCMEPAKTNLRQRVGYFGANNGIFLEQDDDTLYLVIRSKSSGSVVENRIAQSSWNVDRLDGTGNSGRTLDVTKSQILFIDIEWLGVGSVRCGFVIDGAFVFAHKFHHANTSNVSNGTYMTTACLPIRYEITNTGATSGASTLKQICTSVISSGGYVPRGLNHVAGRGLAYYTFSSAGTFYNLVSIKLDPDYLDDIIIPTEITVLTDSNLNINFKLVVGATFASALTFTNITDSVLQSISDQAVTDQGTILNSRFVVNKGESRGFTREELEVLQLERDNNGAITLSLIATADTPNAKVAGNISFIEAIRGT